MTDIKYRNVVSRVYELTNIRYNDISEPKIIENLHYGNMLDVML